jgi:hypothetical protein
MLHKKFTVQVTTLPECDDITRFDGTRITVGHAVYPMLPLPFEITAGTQVYLSLPPLSQPRQTTNHLTL